VEGNMLNSMKKTTICITLFMTLILAGCANDVNKQQDTTQVTTEPVVEASNEGTETENSTETEENTETEESIESEETAIQEELIEYSENGLYLSIVIPDGWGWEYDIKTSEKMQKEDGLMTCAIEFWNEDYPDDVFQLGYMTEKLGMCATGVTIENYIMENGIYGTSFIEKYSEKVWLTITLNNPNNNIQGGDYLVQGSPSISAWDNLETEFYQILSTAWVGPRVKEME
jgi:hypothetical protein